MKVKLGLPIAPTLNRIWTLHAAPQLGVGGQQGDLNPYETVAASLT
jgi:hypothetical protein